MFWLRSKKNNFQLSTLIWGSAISVSNGLDPDQDRYYVGPDLDPNCLQRLSAVDKSLASTERVKISFVLSW